MDMIEEAPEKDEEAESVRKQKDSNVLIISEQSGEDDDEKEGTVGASSSRSAPDKDVESGKKLKHSKVAPITDDEKADDSQSQHSQASDHEPKSTQQIKNEKRRERMRMALRNLKNGDDPSPIPSDA